MHRSPTPAPTPIAPATARRRFARLEAEATASLVQTLPRAKRLALGLRVETLAGATVIACQAEPHLMVNRVFGWGTGGAPSEEDVDAVLGRARFGSRPDNFIVNVGEDLADAVIPQLTRRGLVAFRRDWELFARDLLELPDVASPLPIARAQPGDGDAFSAIMSEGFALPDRLRGLFAHVLGRPDWHVYLAYDGQRPVGAAVMYVHEHAAYLHGAATLPSHRGLGVQPALIARRAQVARALGCDVLLVETGAPVAGEPDPSRDNLIAYGFSRVGIRRNLVPAGTTWTTK